MYNLRDVLTVTLRLIEFIQPKSNDSAFLQILMVITVKVGGFVQGKHVLRFVID